MPDRTESDLRRLLAEEPFVRSLAQQLVVEDADDVVQQTFLRALQRGGKDIDRPRRWLGRIVRNVAANLRRGERRRRDRQRAAAVREPVPSSAELAEREERRRELVAAVDGLPPAVRRVMLLRWFDGLPPRRIAATLGVPVATVWTQLHLGAGKLSGIGGHDDAPPFPALTRSDADGRFHAIGIPAGEQPVQVRAPGFAPWQGSCAIAPGSTAPLRVELGAGATIEGTVRDAAGDPVARATVEVGKWDDLEHYRTWSAADGSFGLEGLPAGDIELRAEHDEFGRG